MLAIGGFIEILRLAQLKHPSTYRARSQGPADKSDIFKEVVLLAGTDVGTGVRGRVPQSVGEEGHIQAHTHTHRGTCMRMLHLPLATYPLKSVRREKKISQNRNREKILFAGIFLVFWTGLISRTIWFPCFGQQTPKTYFRAGCLDCKSRQHSALENAIPRWRCRCVVAL